MNLRYLIVYTLDRAFSGKGWKQIVSFIILAILIFSVFFGLSFLIIPSWEIGNDNVSRIYQLICVFTGVNPVPNSESAWRAYIWFVALLGSVVFCGSVISVISNILERRVESFRNGQISYKMKNHVVIIGFNDMVPALIKQILENPAYNGYRILVQSETPTEFVRNRIHINIPENLENRIIILNAKRNSLEELVKLCTVYAKEVFIIGESKEFDHDSINIDCLSKMADIHEKFSEKNTNSQTIPVTVWFENQTTFTAFQTADLSQRWRKYFEFRPINFHNEWAKRILINNQCSGTRNYPALDYKRIDKDSELYVHLVIVGMNNMGIALATETAQLLHFPNFIQNPQKKTLITFIDESADIEMEFFIKKYRHFFEVSSTTYYDYSAGEIVERKIPATKFTGEDADFLDVSFEFIKGNIALTSIHNQIDKWACSENELLSIAVCLSNPQNSIAIGMYFPDSVYDNNIPVFVRTSSSDALLRAINPEQNAVEVSAKMKYSNLYPFTEFPKQDKLHENWLKLSVALQWSNLYHAYSIPVKLRNIGMPHNNKELFANVEHNRWLVEKLLLGYRKPTAKEMEEIISNPAKADEYKGNFVHVNICPYSALNDSDKNKNAAFAEGIISL